MPQGHRGRDRVTEPVPAWVRYSKPQPKTRWYHHLFGLLVILVMLPVVCAVPFLIVGYALELFGK
jgi:hypothetical protein